MIYIWDNGEDYEDHAIRFIDDCGLTAREMDCLAQMVRTKQCYYEYSEYLAVASEMTWRKDFRPSPVYEWVEMYDLVNSRLVRDTYGKERTQQYVESGLASIMGTELVRKLVAMWRGHANPNAPEPYRAQMEWYWELLEKWAADNEGR